MTARVCCCVGGGCVWWGAHFFAGCCAWWVGACVGWVLGEANMLSGSRSAPCVPLVGGVWWWVASLVCLGVLGVVVWVGCL